MTYRSFKRWFSLIGKFEMLIKPVWFSPSSFGNSFLFWSTGCEWNNCVFISLEHPGFESLGYFTVQFSEQLESGVFCRLYGLFWLPGRDGILWELLGLKPKKRPFRAFFKSSKYLPIAERWFMENDIRQPNWTIAQLHESPGELSIFKDFSFQGTLKIYGSSP